MDSLVPGFQIPSMEAGAVFHGENRGVQMGQNLGIFNMHTHNYTPQNATAIEEAKPSSTVPVGVENDFTGREDILEQIEASLLPASEGHREVILHGLGGVGKSQIAVEYALRHRKAYPETWVFLVIASSAATFEKSYRDIANAAKILIPEEEKGKMLDKVSTWLQGEKSGRWLMILDGGDDSKVLFSQEQGYEKPLAKYIPKSANGSVLLTTRNKKVGTKLWQNIIFIHVKPLSTLEARELFLKKYAYYSAATVKEDSLNILLEQLECWPLAIAHAVAYMQECEKDVDDYLALLRSDEGGLLGVDLGDPSETSQIPHSVFSTWKISYERISTTEPAAEQLFSIMCFLNREGISEALIKHALECADICSEVEFHVALGVLKSYQLVNADGNSKHRSLGMHRLVQVSMKSWLKEKGFTSAYATLALMTVSSVFAEEGDSQDWPQLLLHAEAVLPFEPDESDVEFKTGLLQQAANRASELGQFKKGEQWLIELQKTVETNHEGQEDGNDEILEAKEALAQLYVDSGEWKKALTIQEAVVEKRKEKHGENHPDSLNSMERIANIYQGQGEFAKAEDLAEHIVQVSLEIKASPPSHLRRRKALAYIYFDMGKHRQAEELAYEVSQELETLAETPDINDLRLATIRVLAWAYKDQGKLDEAIKWTLRLVEMKKDKRYGASRLSTIDSVGDLALAYEAKGMFKEAWEYSAEAVSALREILGETHPNTLANWSNLGLVYEKLGYFELAEECVSYVVKKSKDLGAEGLGEEHPDTLLSKGLLASIWRNMGRLEEAAELSEKVLEGREKVLPKGHPDTLFGIIELALTYHKQGRLEDTKRVMLRVEDRDDAEDVGKRKDSTDGGLRSWRLRADICVLALILAIALNFVAFRMVYP